MLIHFNHSINLTLELLTTNLFYLLKIK